MSLKKKREEKKKRKTIIKITVMRSAHKCIIWNEIKRK